jgi:mono/diheme cytochrome c family protein
MLDACRIAPAILAVVMLTGTACEPGLPAGRTPHREFNWTDMGNQPKLKPQRADLFGVRPGGMIVPPAGAVATAEHPYPFAADKGADAADWATNPLQPTPNVLVKGKWVYENYCIVCHGPEAAGDGKLTKLFPVPPSLMRPRTRGWSDARIFHVPMRGQGSMPKLSSQIEPQDLWAVVHHIRAFQARLPVAPATEKDIEEEKATEAARLAATPAAEEPDADTGSPPLPPDGTTGVVAAAPRVALSPAWIAPLMPAPPVKPAPAASPGNSQGTTEESP